MKQVGLIFLFSLGFILSVFSQNLTVEARINKNIVMGTPADFCISHLEPNAAAFEAVKAVYLMEEDRVRRGITYSTSWYAQNTEYPLVKIYVSTKEEAKCVVAYLKKFGCTYNTVIY